MLAYTFPSFEIERARVARATEGADPNNPAKLVGLKKPPNVANARSGIERVHRSRLRPRLLFIPCASRHVSCAEAFAPTRPVRQTVISLRYADTHVLFVPSHAVISRFFGDSLALPDYATRHAARVANTSLSVRSGFILNSV